MLAVFDENDKRSFHFDYFQHLLDFCCPKAFQRVIFMLNQGAKEDASMAAFAWYGKIVVSVRQGSGEDSVKNVSVAFVAF